MRIKESYVYRLFLCCFLIYAISPLSYAFAPDASADRPAGQKEAAFRNFNIYFFEAFLKGLFLPEAEETIPSDLSILLAKKQTVIRQSSDIRQKFVKCIATAASFAEYREPSVEKPDDDVAAVYQSVEAQSYSGLSPPRSCA